jgi:hypothetical protein
LSKTVPVTDPVAVTKWPAGELTPPSPVATAPARWLTAELTLAPELATVLPALLAAP